MSDRILALISRMRVCDQHVKEGHAADSPVTDTEARAKALLRKKMEGLELLFEKDGTVPDGDYKPPQLQCIQFDPHSDYAQERRISHGNDQWWGRLEYNYHIDGQNIRSDVFPLFGCYIDLHRRTSKKLEKYGSTLVNIYVPTPTVKYLFRELSRCGYNIADGKEIVDESQGLTSFLMSTVRDKTDLNIRLYQVVETERFEEDTEKADDETKETKQAGEADETNKDDNKVQSVEPDSHNRTDMPMSEIYGNHNTPHMARILGGVAFMHLIAGYECSAGQIPKTRGPPEGATIDAKFKIVGFHALGMSGLHIKQITYNKKKSEDY